MNSLMLTALTCQLLAIIRTMGNEPELQEEAALVAQALLLLRRRMRALEVQS